MVPVHAGRHNNQAGFVILGSVADDLKRLAIEWVMWVFYRDGFLRIVTQPLAGGVLKGFEFIRFRRVGMKTF